MSGFIFIVITIAIAIIVLAIFSARRNTDTTNDSRQRHDPLYIERMADAKRYAEEHGDKEALQAILEDRYDQLMQERARKRQSIIRTPTPSQATTSKAKTNIPIREYDIAGINFRKGIENYVGDFKGYLKPQPTNRHDPNAIAIYHSDGHHLGYIPAYETANVRALHLPFPIPVSGHIDEAYDEYENRRFFIGVVYIKK